MCAAEPTQIRPSLCAPYAVTSYPPLECNLWIHRSPFGVSHTSRGPDPVDGDSPVNRVHLPELIDFAWMPSGLRTSVTNLIVVAGKMLGASEVLAALVSRVLREGDIQEIVDLGSGAGGCMPEVLRILREDSPTADVSLIMTDLYPNLDAIAAFNTDNGGCMRYHPDPVSLTELSAAPTGLKTMVNCFHHLRPEQARELLASAAAARQPLLIYEMGQPFLPLWLFLLSMPIAVILGAVMVFFMTPFVRPLTLRQLVFTYVIPIVPLIYGWDGQASMPRLYSLDDLDELLEGLERKDYHWETGQARTRTGRRIGTYLIGLP